MHIYSFNYLKFHIKTLLTCFDHTIILRLHVAQGTPTARLSLNTVRLTQYTRHAATASTQHNDINHSVFLKYNFSNEQCMLPEDDRVIETCRSVLSILM